MRRPLSALATYENGYPFKPADLGSDGTPVVRIRQLIDRHAEVDRHLGELPDRFVIDDGDLIFSWSGSLAVRTWDRGRSYLNQHLFRVVPAEGVERRWLGYVLEASIRRLNGLMHGSAMTHLTKPMLKMVDWHVPDEAEQRRVSDFLDDRVARIDRIIDARREQIELVQAMYQSALDDLVTPYSEAPMRRFTIRIEQGWSPVTDSVPARDGHPGVLKLGAVRAGDFRPTSNKAFLPGAEPRREYLLAEGDLLVTRANTPKLVGGAAVVTALQNAELYLSDLIYRVRLDGYDPHLASAALRTSRVRQMIAVVARGTSNSMPKLRGEDLAALPLPVVPEAQQANLGQRDIRARQERDVRSGALARSVDLLIEYKTSLITAAVAGELDVTTAGSGIPG